MMRSINQLFGVKLGATDGEIGHVKDLYFDDRNWAIRYLVADTGLWLPGRQVLLAPYSLSSLDPAGKVLRVNLTRKQIENSPSMDAHKPVSRQYEEEYYRYYGWPFYWRGDALWGMSGFPILELPPVPLLGKPSRADGPEPERADAHLRSAQSVKGYQFRAGNETLGHICDFMMDPGSWAIGQLAIKTGHRLSGNEVLVPTKEVIRISYEESTVFATVTGEVAVSNAALPPVAVR